MNITAESVKEWLKSTGRDREWIANQCGAEVKTVNNWLSSGRGIPSKGLIIIEKLMREDAAKSIAMGQEPPVSYITITTTLGEFCAWEKAAKSKDRTLTEWALEAVREAYEADQNSSEENVIPLAGEEPKRKEG